MNTYDDDDVDDLPRTRLSDLCWLLPMMFDIAVGFMI